MACSLSLVSDNFMLCPRLGRRSWDHGEACKGKTYWCSFSCHHPWGKPPYNLIFLWSLASLSTPSSNLLTKKHSYIILSFPAGNRGEPQGNTFRISNVKLVYTIKTRWCYSPPIPARRSKSRGNTTAPWIFILPAPDSSYEWFKRYIFKQKRLCYGLFL